MGDVEDMIGELEDGDEPGDEAPEGGDGDEPEETFGLDLDSAWRSPDREAD